MSIRDEIGNHLTIAAQLAASNNFQILLYLITMAIMQLEDEAQQDGGGLR